MHLALSLALLSCRAEPRPALTDSPDWAAPAPSAGALSRVSVPLEYDFSAVLRLVEGIVPTTLGSMDSVRAIPDDGRRHYAFEAERGPFTAFADGNLLHLRTTLTYRARGFYKPPLAPTISAGCGFGADRPRVVVELATPVGLSPAWHLVSHARIVSIAAASTAPRDHCDVSMLHRDVTSSVVEAARAGLQAQMASIDAKVGAIDLSGRVTEWWAMLAHPIRLADGVWLVLGPERLRAGQVSGHSRILTVPVSLDARPTIVVGPTEPVVVVNQLPPLGRDSGSSGFHIVIDGIIDYGLASRELASAMRARKFSASGHTVTLTGVNVLPQPKGRLALDVSFTGEATGTLRLTGTPFYARPDKVITVPDLDFDLQSDSKLIQTYSWLTSSALRTELRRKARIPVSSALARGRALLLQGLNRKIAEAVTLSATVDSVAVRGLFVTRDGMLVRAEATGRAGVSVRQR